MTHHLYTSHKRAKLGISKWFCGINMRVTLVSWKECCKFIVILAKGNVLPRFGHSRRSVRAKQLTMDLEVRYHTF